MFLKRLSAAVVIVTCFGWAAMGAASDSLTTATNDGKEKSALAPLAVDFAYTINKPTCNGDADGSIDVRINTPASGTFKVELAVGAGAYSTVIASTSSKTFPIPNLRANTYKVRITEIATLPNQVGEVSNIVISDFPVLNLNLSQKTDCTCPSTSDGSIRLSASGGDNSSYLYTLTPGGTNSTGVFNNLAGNIYTGLVIDGNGCQRSISNIEIITPTSITASIPSIIIDSINYAGDVASITLNGLPSDISSYQVLLDGAPSGAVVTGSSAIISNVAVGSHTVKIQRIGCSSDSWTSAPIVISNYLPITFTWSPNPNPQDVTINCYGGDTTLTVTVNGGRVGKTVQLVLLENGVPRDVATALPFGISLPISDIKANVEYTLLAINEAQDATRYPSFKLIGPQVPFTIDNVTPTNVTCNGQSDGKVLVTISGGTSPFKYTLNGSVPNSFSPTLPTNRTITNLGGGTNYNLQLVDEKGCLSNSQNFTISEPSPISVVVLDNLTEQLTCPNASTGKIFARGAGGTKPYYFTLTKGGSVVAPYSNYPVTGDTAIFSNLSDGTYTITIKDGFCATTQTDEETIDPVVVNLNVAYDTIQCNNGTTRITATATGGDGSAFSYTLIDSRTGVIVETKQESVSGSGVVFDNKPASTYRVQATYGSCSPVSKDIFIENPRPLNLTFDSTVRVKCPGESIDVKIYATGNYPYEYSLDGINYTRFPEMGNFTLEDLVAGSYSLYVRDKFGCVYNNGLPSTIVVTEPDEITISDLVIKDVLCKSKRNGSVSLNVGGGTPGYTLYLVDNATAEITKTYPSSTGVDVKIPNVPAGSYSLRIKDKAECFAANLPTDITINEPDSLKIDPPVYDPIKCFGEVAVVTFSVSGGWPVNKTITIVGEGQNATVASGTNKSLKAGTYTLTANDDNGCRATDVLTIAQPEKLVLTVTDKSNISCNGAADASITFKVTGGTPDYQYGLGGSGSASTSFTGNTYTIDEGLEASSYNLVVKDNNGCQSTVIPITITEPQVVDFTYNSDSVSCFGGSDGRIILTATGGDRTYRTFLTKQGGTESISTYPVINGLSFGTYQVRVVDSKNCTSETKTIIIDEPTQIIINGATVTHELLCYNDQNASIEIDAIGGSPYNLQYKITGKGYQSSNIFNNLSAGEYEIWVRNEFGNCETKYSQKLVITNPDPIVFETPTIDNVSCFNEQDGSIQIKATGGTGTLSYYLVNAPARIEPNPNETGRFENLGELNSAFSKYVYRVVDQNGCFKRDSFFVNNPPELKISLLSFENVRCNNDANGTITVEVTGGTGAYSFKKDVGQGITSNVEVINTTNYKLTNYTGGVFNPIVIDAKGCSKMLEPSVTIKDPPLLVILDPIEWGTKKCNYSTDDITIIYASGGTPGYYYSLDNGDNFGSLNDSIIENLPEGNKYPMVRDRNGCLSAEVTNPFYFKIPDPVGVEYEFFDILCHKDDDGALANGDMELKVSGGTGPYYLGINDASFGSPYAISKAVTNTTTVLLSDVGIILGPDITYRFYLKDANNCRIQNIESVRDIGDKFAEKEFKRPPLLVLDSLKPYRVKCGGEPTGKIEFFASGGTAPKEYTNYSLTVIPDQRPELRYRNDPGLNVVEHLWAGSYKCILTDANGCKAESNIGDLIYTDQTVIDADNKAITISISALDTITCNETNDGSLSITVKNFLEDGIFWEAQIWEYDTVRSTRPYTALKEGYLPYDPIFAEGYKDHYVYSLYSQKILEDIGIGIYHIEVTDSQSLCKASVDTVLYSVLGDSCPPLNFYNAFTQYSGGDEYNTWNFGGSKNLVYNLKIFTAWGDLVYDSYERKIEGKETKGAADKFGIRWDGLDNKQRPVPAGTYIYLLRTGVPPNETVRDGNVTILRNNGR